MEESFKEKTTKRATLCLTIPRKMGTRDRALSFGGPGDAARPGLTRLEQFNLAPVTGKKVVATQRLVKRPIKDYIRSGHFRSQTVRYSSQVKPISYLKANAAEVLAHLAENRKPLVITQNGEARAVLQDVASFEETQETLALLKVLALGQQDVEAGRLRPVGDVVARLRAKQTED